MRIIAGHLQGMRIQAPLGSQVTRPTSAKVREALFNIIQDRIQKSVFVDLFSGTGAVGIEAVGRGAKAAYFVEQNKNALMFLRKNITLAKERLDKQGFSKNQFYVYPVDIKLSLKKLQTDCQADIIWADPPYAQLDSWMAVLREELGLFAKKGALFILEVANDMVQYATLDQASWVKVRQKTYGSTSLMIWEYLGDING